MKIKPYFWVVTVQDTRKLNQELAADKGKMFQFVLQKLKLNFNKLVNLGIQDKV